MRPQNLIASFLRPINDLANEKYGQNEFYETSQI